MKPLDAPMPMVLLALSLFASPAAADGFRHLDPDSLPAPNGYSHVIVAPPGRLVAISGQVALDESGNLVGKDDFRAQCVQVFENLKRALAAAGLGFDDVIRLDMYVTDIGKLPVLREVRDRYLPAANQPTSTLVQVEALVRPELELEISALAVAARDADTGGGAAQSGPRAGER